MMHNCICLVKITRNALMELSEDMGECVNHLTARLNYKECRST